MTLSCEVPVNVFSQTLFGHPYGLNMLTTLQIIACSVMLGLCTLIAICCGSDCAPSTWETPGRFISIGHSQKYTEYIPTDGGADTVYLWRRWKGIKFGTESGNEFGEYHWRHWSNRMYLDTAWPYSTSSWGNNRWERKRRYDEEWSIDQVDEEMNDLWRFIWYLLVCQWSALSLYLADFVKKPAVAGP